MNEEFEETFNYLFDYLIKTRTHTQSLELVLYIWREKKGITKNDIFFMEILRVVLSSGRATDIDKTW